MTSTRGCWLGKQGAGGTIENSQDFVCKFQGNAMVLVCVTSCYTPDMCKYGSAKGEMQDQPRTPCFLLTGLYKAQGSWVIPTLELFADLQPLAERWLVTYWSFWGLAALSVTSFLNPECPLLTAAFLLLFAEVVQLKPSYRNSSSVFHISCNCNYYENTFLSW